MLSPKVPNSHPPPPEQKFLKFIDESEQQRDKLKIWQHGLEETLELKVQDLIGQNKQQKVLNEGWRQELEDTLEKRI
jgi:spore cortex formation protein SpoVR/YcgB (stage V sporulation)